MSTDLEVTAEAPATKPERVPANLSGSPHYATHKHPLIEAIIHELYRFHSQAQAFERMQSLRLIFTVAKQQINNPNAPSLILWIKGYGISPEDKKNGVMGNFAVISIKHLDGGIFTLTMFKMEVDLKFHPMRRVVKAAHPNWGHPILRRIQKEELLEDVEDARKLLQALNKAYPQSSILCTNKLYIIIFSRENADTKTPTHKYVLEIKAQAEGGFRIHFEKNNYKAPKKLPKLAPQPNMHHAEPERPAPQPQGYFTRMLQEKKK